MFELPSRALAIREQVETFFRSKVLPANRLWHSQVHDGQAMPVVEETLRRDAKALGLWNLALPRLGDDDPGTRMTNLEFTAVAEILGRLEWASRVFNCHAPDVPNIELLQLFATAEQRERWLKPMLEGEFGSAFGMTEPDVASSDPINLQTSIVRDGDDYVINGRKWFTSNASHPRCELLVVIGVTDPGAARAGRQSMVLVPMGLPGLGIERVLSVYGRQSITNPHPVVVFDNVRIPAANLLGREGAGFVQGQARLGPARLHHCMRAIGSCEVLISLMVQRSQRRSAFGNRIDHYSSTKEAVALSRIELEQARLLVQKAAWMVDTVGNKAARKEISMIKVAVSRVYQQIADRTIQIFGAKGVTDDTPAWQAFANARGFRIYDGPDEVHLQTIHRFEAEEQDLTDLDHYLLG